ncbi:TPA: hypothetical protein DD449_02845 [Candidatus Berkelbacteria bacterium]|uniref:Uncharacterized protein n=1 Tax=Berkelbacteria bacterium GW2011_GWE1_39_12 TaxID=1618337 RepID=A0A0G4B4T9_9BACT|nr:MAG: hypothetical protein UT28_C0001G0201 [Berkelbacteria bacterium GW2011_GWE1_39_12]HBO60595.1 hypothetical protein [Candidatus Berkelbacteria bacterium]
MAKPTLRSEFLKTMTQLATAAFGFVAALAWNTAIQALIDKFIEPGNGVRSKIYYALVVTVVAVIVTYFLGKATQEETEKEEKKN